MAQGRNCDQKVPLSLITEILLTGFQGSDLPYKQAKGELTVIIQESVNMINFECNF